MAQDDKISKYEKKRFRFSFGIIIGILLLAYVGFSLYHLATKKQVNFYEVTDGGMAKDTQHTGIIFRNEQTQYADGAGYINFFVTSGKRVSVGETVYAIDDSGQMNQYLNKNSSASLTEGNEKKVKKSLSSFASNFKDQDFSAVYDARTSANTALNDSVEYTSDEVNNAMYQSGGDFNQSYSPSAGVIAFTIDGYEDKQPETVTEEDFNKDSYSAANIKTGQMVETNSPVYKLVTAEEWYVVFKLTDEQRAAFSNMTRLNVTFKSNGIAANALYTQINAADGNSYGKLTFNRYMVDFINDRFVNFEIDEESLSGLKIPKSAIVTKTFLVVPIEYLAHGGDNVDQGFYKEVTTDKGTSIEYIPTEIYYQTDKYYYINFSSGADFQPGDYVVKPATSERFKLGETASLEGVYNINKGYAVFKQVDVLDSNDEYYTVKKNQKYGLSVYDHILFDPEGINEGDFIYE